jgi:hypothetical protein
MFICTVFSIPVALQISTVLYRLRLIKETGNIVFGIAIVSSISWGCYKFYKFNREMDAKYTPIWLKSTGKLEKSRANIISI